MPRGGSKPGERRGGRQKGTPNKLTSTARSAFLAAFGELEGEFKGWIEEIAKTDPGRAAELLIRMAEYHFPKLGRTEVEHSGGLGVTLEQLVPKRKPPTEGEG